ncbi:MAG TPA: AAA family ATPase [Pedobacter sp.]|uniref:NACHT and WD repeat domain-containing protein n=1 Tax=Pedobacter sp. TaxID=1411316 RepID=UPI002D160FF9|nr:AAA family ATPase [Pedobacter sp.]HMI03899.1 AAA family ATPase [Pedobacter sp.]
MLNTLESKLTNPFPGLRSFEETEAELFFGRQKQIGQLLQKFLSVRFLMVIGSAGSGKSSLVKAGLIPALQNDSTQNWQICIFKPECDPIANMAYALAEKGVLYSSDTAASSQILNKLNESESALLEIYNQSRLAKNEKLLLIVDDFENLFRFSIGNEKNNAAAFIQLLLKTTEAKHSPISVLLTMRSDFLGNCTEFNGLPEAINNGQYLVSKMNAAEQQDAIVKALSIQNVKFSADLTTQLSNDIKENQDQLTLLEHAMMRTWDYWENNKNSNRNEIDFESYEQAGTLDNALSQHLEEAYSTLKTSKDQQICKAMFCALVTMSGPFKGMRRPRKLAELCELANASEAEIIAVTDIFRNGKNNFITSISTVPLTPDSILDIAHESILKRWERLITWIEDEETAAQTYLRLCDAANLYEAGKGGLLRDPELQVTWKWKEEQQPTAIWAGRYNDLFDKAILFLEYSKTQFEKELVFKEKMQKQRLLRAKRISIIISVIALGAFLLAIYSFELKNLAKRQTVIAEKESVEAKRQRKLAQEQERLAQKSKENALLSAKLALEQKNIAQMEQEKATKSEKNALLQKVIAEQQKAFADRQKTIAELNATIAKQQQSIAETQTERAVSNEKIAVEQKQISARLKDLAEARNLSYQAMLLLNDKKFDESKKEVLSAYTLNATNNGPLQNNDIYTSLQFNWVNEIQHKNQFAYHKYPVRSVAHGPAADQLVSIDESGMVYLSKVVNGILEPVASYDVKDEARSISTSPDGLKAVVVTATGNAILLGLNANGPSVKELTIVSFPGIGRQVLFKNNSEFAILSSKGLGIYRANTVIETLKFSNGIFTAMNYGSSGKLYLAAGNKISVYNDDADLTGTSSTTFTLPSKITSIVVSPADDYLAAGTYDGGIWIKELKSNKPASSFTPHASSINDLKFSMVGGGVLQLASASSDQTIKLIDVKALMASRSTEDILTLRTHNKWVYCLWYTPDGKFLYTGSEDKKIVGWHSTMAGMYRSLTTDKN